MTLIPYAKATTTIGFFPFAQNTRFIEETIIAGGQPTDYRLLAAIGVDLVVNLTDESDEEECKAAGIENLQVPVGELHPIHLDAMKDLIWKVRAAWKAGKKIYVHCKWGSDRTGYFVAAWRKWVDGWDMDVIRMEFAMFVNPQKLFRSELWFGIADRIDSLEKEE